MTNPRITENNRIDHCAECAAWVDLKEVLHADTSGQTIAVVCEEGHVQQGDIYERRQDGDRDFPSAGG